MSTGMRLAGLLLCATLAVTGCASAGPSAQEWAGTVCGALGPWRTTIADLNARAQAKMAEARTPAQARTNLLELLESARVATAEALAAVVAAGAPDVSGGAEVAARFADALTGARDAYAKAGVDLRALAMMDPKLFYDQLVAIFATLNTEYAKAGVDTAGLDSAELRAAFAEAQPCR
jgi:hypothetical protein